MANINPNQENQHTTIFNFLHRKENSAEYDDYRRVMELQKDTNPTDFKSKTPEERILLKKAKRHWKVVIDNMESYVRPRH